MKTCTFFGHRDCPCHIEPILYDQLVNLIETQDVRQFLVGDTGYFDTLVRRVLRRLQKEYAIEYAVVLAYLPRSTAYAIPDDTIFPEGIEKVPPRFAILYRNQYMLERADVVVTYITRPFGGAAKFAQKAVRQKKTVINLANHP